MSAIHSFTKKHPVLCYYLMTFAISWGAIFTALSRGIPTTREQFDAALPVAIVAMLLGPSLSSVVMIMLTDGRVGFRSLRERLFKPGVSGLWYAIALLSGPVLIVVSLLLFLAFFPEFPPKAIVGGGNPSIVIMGLTSGLVVGICEELGWAGFVMPRVSQKHGILATGLFVGVLWGIWHIASHAVMASGIYSAPLSPALYIALRAIFLALGPLLAFRVLMVWVYDRSGSLLTIMLMHFAYTAATISLEPAGIAGMPVFIFDIISTAVLWAVIGIIALVNGGRLEKKNGN